MSAVRKAAVAGTWYPAERDRLASAVDAHLARVEGEAGLPVPLALIAPHAALPYSGPVAAYAYASLHGARYRAVVLVGPSHFVPFHGTAIWPAGAWDTPLGPVPVDAALAAAIVSESSSISERPAAHGREHSLEMQMPFVARVLPGVPIVPLVMGHQSRDTAVGLGEALARAIASNAGAAAGDRVEAGPLPRDANTAVLLVASSDLSHFEDAHTAVALDRVVIRHVEALDPDGLMDRLEREPRHACGGGPMVAVLTAARRLGASGATMLRYADSGDVSGDKSSVVGYMAAAVW